MLYLPRFKWTKVVHQIDTATFLRVTGGDPDRRKQRSSNKVHQMAMNRHVQISDLCEVLLQLLPRKVRHYVSSRIRARQSQAQPKKDVVEQVCPEQIAVKLVWNVMSPPRPGGVREARHVVRGGAL